GAALDGKSLCELFEAEKVTFGAGVPTVWFGVLQHLAESGRRLSTLKRAMTGGSACPPAMMRALEEEHGIDVLQGWGMSETSPIGTIAQLKAKHSNLSAEERRMIKCRQGRAIYGIDLKIVDGDGRELPWDGKAFGDL